MKTVKSIRIITTDQKNMWDSSVSHPLQTWEWGEFRKQMGIDLVRLGYFEDTHLKYGWQISFHTIPHTKWTIGYIPKGPLPTPQFIDVLRNTGKEKHSVFIQIEPNVMKKEIQILRDNEIEKKEFSRSLDLSGSQSPASALPPSQHPLFSKYTFILDLTKSEEDLLASMHPKTRYNIKIAQKHNVEVRENNSHEAFEKYLALTEDTTQRQAFFAHGKEYHRKMWECMHNAGLAKLFTAQYQNQILAAWIVFVWKDTLYYPYGASSRLNREVMAPTLMLWETARWGKRLGLKQYDLWGAMGPSSTGEPDTKDPWYGFHRFKEGFHPDLVEFLGSFDFIVHPLLYKMYSVADVVRWKYLKFKKSFS